MTHTCTFTDKNGYELKLGDYVQCQGDYTPILVGRIRYIVDPRRFVKEINGHSVTIDNLPYLVVEWVNRDLAWQFYHHNSSYLERVSRSDYEVAEEEEALHVLTNIS